MLFLSVEPEPPNAAFRLLSIKELARAEQESSTKVCTVPFALADMLVFNANLISHTISVKFDHPNCHVCKSNR